VLSQRQMTAEEFLLFVDQHPDKRFDFVDGEIVEVSPKRLHGRTQTIVVVELEQYTHENPIGIVHTETLHDLQGRFFLPDVSVNRPTDSDYFTEPPILVVEIRSDTQSRESQRRKARAYIERGTAMVWLFMPGEGVEVYRPGHEPVALTPDDTLTGYDVLPGFNVLVRTFFPE